MIKPRIEELRIGELDLLDESVIDTVNLDLFKK